MIVTSLLVVGDSGAVAPDSLSGARSVTLTVVAEDRRARASSCVHGSGDVTLVMTSEINVDDGVPGVTAPRMPCS